MDRPIDRRTILKVATGALGAQLLPAFPAWAQAPAQAAVATADLGVPFPASSFKTAMAENARTYLGAWANLPDMPVAAASPLTIGASGPAVAALRKRLGLRAGEGYDAELGNAVAGFRAAHGLPAGSHTDATLLAMLNSGPSHFAAKVRANLARINRLPGQLADRFVLVDSASQMLFMIENGTLVETERSYALACRFHPLRGAQSLLECPA
jgi:murein L,D-transpeptidase YcbB/YkuD